MSRMCRLMFGPAVVAIAAAGLMVSANFAGAQPPDFKGKGFEKERGERKTEGEKRGEGERKADRERGNPADAFRRLEAELDRVKAMEAELQAQMRRLKESMERGPMPREGGPEGPRGFGPGGPGGRGFGGPGGPGGFGPGGPGGRGFGGPGMLGGVGPGSGLPIDRMSAEQIKELIGKLQKALAEKTRGEKPGADKPRGEKPGADKPGADKPRGEKPGAGSQDEILKRLDRLSKEIEDIRRSMKR